MEKKVFFLNPPSYKGFDGGAGSRYQAKREVRSFWYPTWLAQAAAVCPSSKLLDAPVENLGVEDTVRLIKGFDIVVIYTSTPGYVNDARIADQIKSHYPDVVIGMVGPHASALPEQTLRDCPSLDFAARGEFECAVRELASGDDFANVKGISYRSGQTIVHNESREPIQDMDSLPSVLDVYKRDLSIEKYFIGYLLHPYLSLYTGRGCAGRCTFCLWPQTIGGHVYRKRPAASVIKELGRAKHMFPEVKEFFFDDDTFTADLERAEEIARGLTPLNLTWSCSARATVPEKTLAIMKESGLRCVMVGLESGSDQILKNIKKGITTDHGRSFMKRCRRLGIVTHATFVMGLPGESRETIRQTIEYAKEIDPDTIQVSIATPYPGTEFYEQAVQNNWFTVPDVVTNSGLQQVSIEYEDLSKEEIFEAVETLYNKFYFRTKPILRILRTMALDKEMRKRRLREAFEFFQFMRSRKIEMRNGRAS